jgi:hypothetical protein
MMGSVGLVEPAAARAARREAAQAAAASAQQGARAAGRAGLVYNYEAAAEAERLPLAPYPPSGWKDVDWLAETLDEQTLEELSSEEYLAQLEAKRTELARYRSDWRLWLGLGLMGAAVVIRWRLR